MGAGAKPHDAVAAADGRIFVSRYEPPFNDLAILSRNDYARADVPMLPVSTTVSQAAWWVLLHTGAAGAVALLMAVTPALGLIYLIPVSYNFV